MSKQIQFFDSETRLQILPEAQIVITKGMPTRAGFRAGYGRVQVRVSIYVPQLQPVPLPRVSEGFGAAELWLQCAEL